MQIIVQIGLDEIVYIVPDRRAVFPHFGGTEFDFCLGFEIRLMDADADCPYYSLPYVRGVEILFIKFLDRLYHCFLERGEVRASVAGVLPVHERSDVFSVIVVMRDYDLYVVA